MSRLWPWPQDAQQPRNHEVDLWPVTGKFTGCWVQLYSIILTTASFPLGHLFTSCTYWHRLAKHIYRGRSYIRQARVNIYQCIESNKVFKTPYNQKRTSTFTCTCIVVNDSLPPTLPFDLSLPTATLRMVAMTLSKSGLLRSCTGGGGGHSGISKAQLTKGHITPVIEDHAGELGVDDGSEFFV